MIRFIKTPDPDNRHDFTRVEIECAHNELTLDNLKDMFKDFALAVGFRLEDIEEDE